MEINKENGNVYKCFKILKVCYIIIEIHKHWQGNTKGGRTDYNLCERRLGGYDASSVLQKVSAKMQYLNLIIQKICRSSPVG